MQRPLLLFVVVVAMTLGPLAAALAPTPGDAARDRRGRARAEVIGGQAVLDGKYPFVVAIGTGDGAGGFADQFCGGSLIGPSSVLTAAHCVTGRRPETLAVAVGQSALESTQGEARAVAGFMIHPRFNPQTLINDVAVLRLDQPVLTIAPIALVGLGDESFHSAGTPLTLVGWGDTISPRGGNLKVHFPLRLQERPISVVADGRCVKRWRKGGFKKLSRAHIVCTTGQRFGAGDSGGPLFALANGTPVQVSLVSGGFPIHQKGVPDLGPQLSEPGIAAFIASVNA